MRESLLEILAAPTTGARLELKVTRHTGDVIDEGELVATDTGAVYPIVDGIPRFVPKTGYTDTFGKQWNLFRTTQLDSATGAAYSEKRFTTETGWSRDDLDGKLVLDAGCGAGRFAEIAARYGGRVVGLDMSSAVDAAKETLAAYPRAELVQASLLEPPFKPGAFDFAYSIGVLQHTPDPEGGLSTVVGCVRPGGRFAFSIYARRPWTKLNAKYLIRPLTRRLPSDLLLDGIKAVMPVVFPVADRVFRIRGLGRLAQFVVPVAVYVDEKGFTEEQRYNEAILDTFDMLSPRFDSPMTWQEAERVLRGANVTSFRFRSRVPLVINGVH
ncbi:MAG: methyltransferase domain-containing protein [Labilithrix sp.]|nr:methyltransferase domain-containing protein [Labilithrix sp.]MCW5814729.1 methyltransferase domain-containing protein [Labilithrix sp.]